MLSFSKLASFASVALSVFVAVSAAPVESRDAAQVWLALNHVVPTAPGDSVWLTGSVPQLKNWALPPDAIALNAGDYTDCCRVWSTNVTFPANSKAELKYIWKKADGTIVWEAGRNRVLNVPARNGRAYTSWNQMYNIQPTSLTPVVLTIEQAVRPAAGQVYMVGGHPKFGNWDPSKGYAMTAPTGTNSGMPIWKARLDFDDAINFEYKLVVKTRDGKYIWEGGANRVLNFKPGVHDVSDLWRDDANTPSLLGVGPSEGGSAIFFLSKIATQPGEKVYVLGNIPQLGNWNVNDAVPLSSLGYTDANPVWWTFLYAPVKRIEYKFIKKIGNQVTWEGGNNHAIQTQEGTYHRAESAWQTQ